MALLEVKQLTKHFGGLTAVAHRVESSCISHLVFQGDSKPYGLDP